jgi:hypothetical protein
VAEAFKKDGGQIRRVVVVPRSTLEGLELKRRPGEDERPRRKSGGAVPPQVLRGYYKHIDKEAGATKLIEMLTGEKPRVYKRCSGWTATRGTGRHRSLGPIRGARGQ